METSVRFVRIQGRAVKPALCFRARNQAHAIINTETCVRVISNIPLALHDRSAPVLYPVPLAPNEPYPINRFVQHFFKIGERKGITARAKFFLTRALDGGVKDDEKLPPDEVPGAPEATREELSAEPKSTRPATRQPASAVKPAAGSSGGNSGASVGSRTAGADVIRRIAVELKLEPTKLRKLLRSKGLSAPYDDEEKIRGALK